jgi:hypothetical protein
LDVRVTATPLYDATLSDLLLRSRLNAAAAEHAAAARVAEVERAAAERVAAAERRAALAEREARVRHAVVADQVEERVRAALALDAPPLPELADRDDLELPERVAPPVPSMQELLRPSPGVNRFFDALLGAAER